MTLHTALGKSCWWICIEDYPKALVAAAGWQQNGNSCQIYWNLTWKGIQTPFLISTHAVTRHCSVVLNMKTIFATVHCLNLFQKIYKESLGKLAATCASSKKVWIKKKNCGVSLQNIHIQIIHNYIHKLYKTHTMHHLIPYDEIQFKILSKTLKQVGTIKNKS